MVHEASYHEIPLVTVLALASYPGRERYEAMLALARCSGEFFLSKFNNVCGDSGRLCTPNPLLELTVLVCMNVVCLLMGSVHFTEYLLHMFIEGNIVNEAKRMKHSKSVHKRIVFTEKLAREEVGHFVCTKYVTLLDTYYTQCEKWGLKID